MLNERGQEFSVFKLLISAIVAIVILTLLLNILGIIDPNINTDPAEAAKNLLTSMDSSIFNQKISDSLDFSREHSINNAALAESVGLNSEQICLLASDNLPADFEGTGSRISRTGSSPQRVKLAGICAYSEYFSNGNYTDYAPELEDITYRDETIGDCFQELSDGEKACLIVLIRSTE